uniref:MULE transposase domain-containing protein n=1 Tax=Rhizophagus irregularis (strain DAOM 181602 / DAOM 197198 / MUCL 43194) TaxID=747089 RepID=U9UTR1_RHIID
MFIDADSALDATIPIVFPETYSAHCIFYIAQNLPKNLKAKLAYVNHYSSKDGTNYLMIIQWQKIISYIPWIKSLNHRLGLIFIKSLQLALKVLQELKAIIGL